MSKVPKRAAGRRNFQKIKNSSLNLNNQSLSLEGLKIKYKTIFAKLMPKLMIESKKDAQHGRFFN
ncbi:hypothetical protein [Petrotoga sibirica]|uniref:Uncharacterized protein n=2 Tax=Petrotoga sibirica TaxID=156202 RepID=A0A4R8ERG1_9BACT|nr:hypothetical protein [Petrotoga sibirica]POZ88311.1 hypothetical protein AA80_06655 [Petrotoga sibirica DSM 13575]TDX15010.1 hypothetical protein C8D74_10845 [Petrotoga sibirica]